MSLHHGRQSLLATGGRLRVRGVLAAISASVALALIAGCTGGPAPTTATSTNSGAPTVGAEPSTDSGAKLAIVPANYGGKAVVTASFSQPMPDRPVDLEAKTAAGWTVVASGQQDHSGAVQFLAPYGEEKYRAVARATAVEASVSTPGISVTDQWDGVFSEDFDGVSLQTKAWNYRLTDQYFGQRLCSASYPESVKLKDGSLLASVSRANAKHTAKAKAIAAKATKKKPAAACPHGVWDSAMVTTQDKYSFIYGTVAVRAKFPAQSGVHGSAWLQSTDPNGAEIDFIESFGSHFGIQNKVWYPKGGKSASLGGYIRSLPEVKTSQWWNDYHVFSVEWTPTEYVFRVDGQETFRTSEGVSQGQHYIILSLLASDWETSRIDPAAMPATMAVDWVKVWQEKK